MTRPELLDPGLLAQVFKANDVRGLVPGELNVDLARRIGAAFITVTGADRVAIGHDMRPSSPGLAAAFAQGVTTAGADAVMIGLASTDELYFASGRWGIAGAMLTASHNPAAYNGIKLCRPGARPVGSDSGLAEIRRVVGSSHEQVAATFGRVSQRDVLADYVEHLVALVPVRGRRLTVVVDAGNGMAGLTAPAVFEGLGSVAELIPMYVELDGTFPNHEANPIDPETLVDLRERVVEEGADVGLAFDGDADRCFLVDERGTVVAPSALASLIAARTLEREPGATIVHNVLISRSVPELVMTRGGRPVRTRVGHSFVKQAMASEDAAFGAEHSGHFYFRDFWFADSGMLAALHALAALADSDLPLSSRLAAFARYVASGEINSTVADHTAILASLRERFSNHDVVVDDDELDGLTFVHADWWINVRTSTTEPLLRLNVESRDNVTMEHLRDEALSIIRSHS